MLTSLCYEPIGIRNTEVCTSVGLSFSSLLWCILLLFVVADCEEVSRDNIQQHRHVYQIDLSCPARQVSRLHASVLSIWFPGVVCWPDHGWRKPVQCCCFWRLCLMYLSPPPPLVLPSCAACSWSTLPTVLCASTTRRWSWATRATSKSPMLFRRCRIWSTGRRVTGVLLLLTRPCSGCFDLSCVVHVLCNVICYQSMETSAYFSWHDSELVSGWCLPQAALLYRAVAHGLSWVIGTQLLTGIFTLHHHMDIYAASPA